MRIRTRVVALAATLALALFGASAATAITNGVPDGANHPKVMVAQDEDGVPRGGAAARCSRQRCT